MAVSLEQSFAIGLRKQSVYLAKYCYTLRAVSAVVVIVSEFLK